MAEAKSLTRGLEFRVQSSNLWSQFYGLLFSSLFFRLNFKEIIHDINMFQAIQ